MHLQRQRWPGTFVAIGFVAIGFVALVATGCGGRSATSEVSDQEFVEFGESALVHTLDLDSSLSDANERAALADELATACLRNRGFDVPQLVTDPIEPEPMALALQEMGEQAFTMEHGFGIVDSAIGSQASTPVDPLDDYIRSLGTTEAESFRLALYGDPLSLDASESCRWIGSVQVDEQLGAQRWDLFGQLSTEVSDRVNADSAVVALHQDYARCMAERGYDYAWPLEPRLAATVRFGEWASTNRFGSGSAADVWATLSDESRASFDKLRARELDEAKDSLECERPVRAELVDLQRQIEQDWIREHNDRIQSLLHG